jgi:tetratricopeptide (TPR) repeat protein
VAISPGQDISTESAATFDATPAVVVLTRLRSLRQAHLLGHVNGRWRLHDLIRRYAVVLEAPSDDATSALLNLLRHYNTLALAASYELLAASEEPVVTDHLDGSPFAGRADALAWLDAEHGNLVAAVAKTVDIGVPMLTRLMADAVLPYLRVRHHVVDRVVVARHARAAADHLDDPLVVAAACGELGAALCDARRFAEAEGMHREAIDRYHRADLPFDEATQWKMLGGTLQEARQFADAEVALRRALDLYGNRRLRLFGKRDPETAAARDVARARVLHDLGVVLYDLTRLEEAITTLRRSVALFRKLDRARDAGSSWSALGLALCEAGKHDEALAAHELARALLAGAPDHQVEAAAWNNLGSALQKAKRFADGVTAHQRAVELYRDSRDPVRRAKAWDNLGLSLQEAGRHGEAITVHRVARDLFDEGGDDFRQAMCCNHLGFALEDVGLPDEAVASHQQALDLYRATGDRGREGRAWITLGAAWQLAGHDARGERCLATAVTEFADCLSQEDLAFVVLCREFARRRSG